MACFRIGPFLFQWFPDGDDPGVGYMRIEFEAQEVEIACSRDQWDEFAEESGP